MAARLLTNQQSWNLLKWLGGGTLGLLFGVGVMIQYGKSTSAVTEKSSVVNLGAPQERPAQLSSDEQIQRALASVQAADPNTRIQGLQSLMAVDQARGIAAVRAALGDASPAVRSTAIGLLASFDVKGSGTAIARLLNDPDPSVRQAASSATIKFAGEPGISAQLSIPLSSGDLTYVDPALSVWRAVLSHDRSAALGVISSALLSSDNDSLSRALAALGPLPNDDLRALSGYLEGITTRMAGQSSAAAAANLLAKLNA